MKQKGKLKYTSNMRSQNEVIQVRCVELKLKVNNNNNNKQQQTTTGDERDEAQGQNHRERVDLFCRLTGRPLSCWAVSRPISDFTLSDRPFTYVTPVTP